VASRVIVKADTSFADKENLFDFLVETNHNFVRLNDATVHADDKEVEESGLSLLKEQLELSFEGVKQLAGDLVLQVRGQLLEVLEFVLDQVKVVHDAS